MIGYYPIQSKTIIWRGLSVPMATDVALSMVQWLNDEYNIQMGLINCFGDMLAMILLTEDASRIHFGKLLTSSTKQ